MVMLMPFSLPPILLMDHVVCSQNIAFHFLWSKPFLMRSFCVETSAWSFSRLLVQLSDVLQIKCKWKVRLVGKKNKFLNFKWLVLPKRSPVLTMMSYSSGSRLIPIYAQKKKIKNYYCKWNWDVITLDIIIIHDSAACLWNACTTGTAFIYYRPLTLRRYHYFSHMGKPEGKVRAHSCVLTL